MSSKRQVQVVDQYKREDLKPPDIDWNKCVICQKDSKEPLILPTEQGYSSLVENLHQYAEFDSLPPHLTSQLFLPTLIDNHGKYHKVCRTKFNSQKIDRLSRKKKPRFSPTNEPPPFDGFDANVSCTKERVTRSNLYKPAINLTCLFCDTEEHESEKLVSAATLDIGSSIFENALLLQDEKLLTKLTSNTDLVALEAKYHKRCYTTFLTKVRTVRRAQNRDQNKQTSNVAYGSVLSELISFMQDCYLYNQTAPLFRLSNLVSFTDQRLQELGFPNVDINRTRLKERLLAFIPGLREDKIGREIVLSFEGDVHNAIRVSCEKDSLSDGMCLARAAKILREDMFQEFPQFSGSFGGEYTSSNCVSPKSVMFFRMLLEGATKFEEPDTNVTMLEDKRKIPTAALSIAQLVRFNSIKRKRKESTTSIRHPQERETPLPLYVGLMLHSQTGGGDIIDKLSHLGLSVSYSRVKSVLNTVTSSICDHFQKEDCVCPPSTASNVFTCAAIDNVDHNTSSNTSLNAFHGTSISLIQYVPGDTVTKPVKLDLNKHSGTIRLPENYTTLPPTPKFRSEVPMNTVNTNLNNITVDMSHELLEWLNYERGFGGCEVSIPWAPYFSRKEDINSTRNKCRTILLPVINEDINSSSVVRHATNIVSAIVRKVNPNQTPVITADQPVYALLKSLQWAIPHEYGEDKIMVMLGGLHIEMAFASAIGTWLEGSGWTDNLVEAHVTTSGRAEGILKASHVKRTRYAHEVSVATLQVLLERAYKNRSEDEDGSFEDWIQQRVEKSAQFMYWKTAMMLECLLLNLVDSIRQGSFTDFVTTLEEICPWMFALDHTNYARWLPVFLYNLKQLPEMHPYIFMEFQNGNISGSKTNRKFSRMAHDQLHEQNNKLIKNTSNNLSRLSQEKQLIQWMVAGPEVVRLIEEFEEDHNLRYNSSSEEHHEDTASFHKRYQTHVSVLVEVFESHGNPFEDEELTTVNSSRIVFMEENANSVMTAKEKGKSQFDAFVEDRLTLRKVSIHEVIKRNNLPLMSRKKVAVKSKDKQKIVDLRKDSTLFAKLYVASQSREMDIKEFFSHENTSCPPSISELGNLRKPSNKSDVVSCIVQSSGVSVKTVHEPTVSSIIIDGAALVHMLIPTSSRTFKEYCDQIVRPYILMRMRTVKRVDIVFDRYLEGSLKNNTRKLRGSGPRVNVKSNVLIPKSFSKFLAHSKNKEELFEFLAENLVKMDIPAEKQLICTYRDTVIGSHNENDFSTISPAFHEEADARLLLHVWHANEYSDCFKVTVKTVDSDVVVIAMYAFSRLPKLEELWVEYGSGKHLQYLPIHELHSKIPQEVSNLLPFFHAFTGVDTVSSFASIGKSTAWKTWMAFRDVDKAFLAYSQVPDNISEDDECFMLIQRFVVLMYHSSSTAETVNDARRILFTHQNRPIENIPPTSNVLLNHLKRAILQCSLWTSCLKQNIPWKDPCEWGWRKAGDDYEPLWSTNSDITMEKLQELIACKCKQICSRCRCVKLGLSCTLLCTCEGQCKD